MPCSLKLLYHTPSCAAVSHPFMCMSTEYVRAVCESQYVDLVFQLSSASSGEEKMPCLVSRLHHNHCCILVPLLYMGITKDATQYPLSV